MKRATPKIPVAPSPVDEHCDILGFFFLDSFPAYLYLFPSQKWYYAICIVS